MPVPTKTTDLEDVLERILAEPPSVTRKREQEAFATFAGKEQDRLILHGAGTLGRIVVKELEKVGVRPIAFTDNNQKLWHTEIDGLPVLPPSIASERYHDSACFVVTIFRNGSTVRRQLIELGCRNVAPFAALFWNHAEVFTPTLGIDLPHKLPVFATEIRNSHGILADEKSRQEFVGQLEWRFWLNYDALPTPSDPAGTYFPLDLVSPVDHEVFVDCGSFQGDTLPSFTSYWNSRFRHIFALEPDQQNREALLANIEGMGLTDRITVMPYAIGERSEFVSFASTGTMGSHIQEGGSVTVECRKLDDIDWPLTPTYIKMDVEGMEPHAIVGAANLLRRHRPILAVCTYHRSEHLWQIPNLIHSIAPEYNVFLRRYEEECWEGICYAIPEHRLR